MQLSAMITMFGSLLLAGLAGSLHCIGMCGPILLGFSQVFAGPPLTVSGQPLASGATDPSRAAVRRSSMLGDFACYHAGRLWTYAMLGALAGGLGSGLRSNSAALGWQRPTSVAIAGIIIVTGVLLLNIIPGLRIDALWSGCGIKRFKGVAWFTGLLHTRGIAARVLLGAVMGLLPCGLVYAMLVVVAALPNPLLAALGMVAFGIGTIPSLSAVVAGSRLLPISWRAQGTRIAAVLIIAMGCWMLARTLLVPPDTATCPFCSH